MAEHKFTSQEKERMLRDVWTFLKNDVYNLYRIWIKKNKEDRILEAIRQRAKIGVLQYELLLNSGYFKKFYSSILYLLRHPHTEIYSEKDLYHLHQIDEIDADVLLSYINMLNGESTKLLAIKKEITSDTYENRAIKGILIKLIQDMNYLIQDLEEIKHKHQQYSKEINKIIDKIKEKRKRISLLSNIGFFKEIPPEFRLKPTPIFMFSPIYSRIYKIWQSYLSFYLPFETNELAVGLIVEWQLYELWVFITILNFVKSILGKPTDTQGIFNEEKGRIKLKIGEIVSEENLCFSLIWQNKWTLHYQKYIPIIGKTNEEIVSYTLPVIPDVTLWNKNDNEIFIFDVKKMLIEEMARNRKYKEIRRTVISQLHQYKDAIIKRDTKEKVVKAAFAIIPKEDIIIKEYKKFLEHWYRKEYGFGFFIFEPQVNGKIENICDYVFGKEKEEKKDENHYNPQHVA